MAGRKAYRLTPRRRAALKKAQAASARKRKRGVSRNAKIGIGVAVGAGTAAALVARHRASGSSFSKKTHHHIGSVSGSVSGSHGVRVSSTFERRGSQKVRQINVRGPKRGPLSGHTSLHYTHVPLPSASTLLGNAVGYRKKVNNDLAPRYNRLSNYNYGSYGKKIPSIAPTMTYGGVRIRRGKDGH